MDDFHDSAESGRLRALLKEAVRDVEPSHSLHEIRERTTSTGPTRRPWLFAAAAAAAATAATIAGVAMFAGAPGTTPTQEQGFADESSEVVVTTEAGERVVGQDDDSDVAPLETSTEPVYYAGVTSRGPRLFREFVRIEAGLDELRAAAAMAVEQAPMDPDYTSLWSGTGAGVESVAHENGVLTVSLDSGAEPLRARPEELSEVEAALAVEQVVYTVQGAAQSRDPVQLLVDGERSDMVLGVPAAEPLAQGDPSEVLAQVWITSPTEGAEVTSPVKVSGSANAFEANVVWQLRQGDQVVEEGFTTAEQCCTLAPYAFRFEAPPGDYTLVVQDTDPSGGEGFAPWQDTKAITVTE